MPRRNIVILLAFASVSLLCYRNAQTNRYGRILASAYNTIEQRSLEPVEPYELFEGAMEGMVERLKDLTDDKYSAFESPKEAEELDEQLRQEFGGLGIEVKIDPKSKFLTVIIPLFDTPAQKAGIRAGDKILRIDDRSTQGLSLQDAVGYLRGKPGEPVTLSILHKNAEEPIDVTVRRDIIEVATVKGDTREADGSWNYFLEGHDRIGYVRVLSFGEKTPAELRAVLEELVSCGMQGLILDLRDNPGGLLIEATEICDMFVFPRTDKTGEKSGKPTKDYIKRGIIVSIRDRDERVRETYRASKDGADWDFPIAVIVNKYSASASEIVAACLQDHERAVIVGERTWGKGTVQEVIQLEDKQGALRLTTASYWRPSIRKIHRKKTDDEDDIWGVLPDDGFEVVVEDDEFMRLHEWRRQRDSRLSQTSDELPPDDELDPFVDRPLQRALEYVENREGGEKREERRGKREEGRGERGEGRG